MPTKRAPATKPRAGRAAKSESGGPANSVDKGAVKRAVQRAVSAGKTAKPKANDTTSAAAKSRNKPDYAALKRELSLRYASYSRRQAPLVDLILQQAKKLGRDAEEIPKLINLEKNHWVALMRGTRVATNMRKDTYEKIAEFLNRSTVEVMIFAGYLKEKDITPQGAVDENMLQLAYDSMRQNPYMLGLVPAPEVWNRFDPTAKAIIIVLYQRLTGEYFFSLLSVPAARDPAGPAQPSGLPALAAKKTKNPPAAP